MNEKNHEKIMKEYKTLKTVLEVPRLRAELRKFDFRGKSFEEFITIMDELAVSIGEQLVSNGLRPPQSLT